MSSALQVLLERIQHAFGRLALGSPRALLLDGVDAEVSDHLGKPATSWAPEYSGAIFGTHAGEASGGALTSQDVNKALEGLNCPVQIGALGLDESESFAQEAVSNNFKTLLRVEAVSASLLVVIYTLPPQASRRRV